MRASLRAAGLVLLLWSSLAFGGGPAVHARAETGAYADTDAVNVLTPAVGAGIDDAAAGWSVNGSYLVDIVSAASVDIVSTATPHWVENRHAGHVAAHYKPHDVGGDVSASISSEPDYLSLSVGGYLTLDLNEKNLTPLLGYAYMHDTAGRTGTPFSVYSLELSRHTLTGGAELVVDRATLLTLSGDALLERGNQEKPYRYVPLFAADVAPFVPVGAPGALVDQVRLPFKVSERLPLSRNRFAASGRLAHRFDESTLQVFERLYLDDWGQKASTTDVRWVFDVATRLRVWPHLRLHTQSAVSFWQRAYVGGSNAGGSFSFPALRTGDRELGPLTTYTLGGGVRWDLGRATQPDAWSLVFQAEGATSRYADALFISHRESLLAALQLEATF